MYADGLTFVELIVQFRQNLCDHLINHPSERARKEFFSADFRAFVANRANYSSRALASSLRTRRELVATVADLANDLNMFAEVSRICGVTPPDS